MKLLLLRAATLVVALVSVADADHRIVAVVASPDVRTATLVTDTGQLFYGDGAGAFVRTRGGGFAAQTTGARQTAEGLLAGTTTGLYRLRDGAWSVQKFRADGGAAAIVGAGPTLAITIGRTVYVQDGARWVRVGAVPSTPMAVWAENRRHVVVLMRDSAMRLKGTRWQRVPVGLGISIAGDDPWLVGEVGATHLSSRRKSPGTIVAAARGPIPWVVEVAPSDAGTAPSRWRLRRLDTLTTVAPPPNVSVEPADITALTGDAAGRIVWATPTAVYLFDGAVWQAAHLREQLPGGSGPGPALSK